MVLQPGMQGLNNGPTSLLARLLAVLGRLAADVGLDLVELADAHQHLAGKRRLGGGMELKEASAHVGPAEGQRDRAVLAVAGQPLEPGVAVHLQHAPEPRQVRRRPLAFSVLGVGVGRRRVAWATPWPVIDGVAPEPPRLGPAAPGVEHRQCGVVGEHLGR